MKNKAGNDPTGSALTKIQTDLLNAQNVLIQADVDKIGDLNDFIVVPYAFGALTNTILAHLNTTYYHVHGTPFVYPNHADDVQLIAAAPAWDITGAKIEVIPASTLSSINFDLHWINVSAISENATIQIDIYKGAAGSEVWIGGTRASRTTNQARNGPSRIQIPQQVADERISCLLSSSTTNATTCLVSFEGHYYSS